MGTNYNGEEPENGVIPKVMDTIFSRVETAKDSTEFLIRVSFIEVLMLKHEDFISGCRKLHFQTGYSLCLILADFQGRGL